MGRFSVLKCHQYCAVQLGIEKTQPFRSTRSGDYEKMGGVNQLYIRGALVQGRFLHNIAHLSNAIQTFALHVSEIHLLCYTVTQMCFPSFDYM